MLQIVQNLFPSAGFLVGLLATLLGLGLFVILPHEFGHWGSAQWHGISTPTFSIGFGSPRWYLGRFHKTNFYISPFMLGGYVEIPELDPGRESEFSILSRMIVVCSGVVVNLVLAWGIVFVLNATVGEINTTPTVVQVVQGYPAESAGFLPGDLILSVNGTPVNSIPEGMKAIAGHANESVQFTVNRSGNIIKITAHLGNESRLGVIFVPGPVKISLLKAAKDSLLWEVDVFKRSTLAITSSTKTFHGPVGILEAGSASFSRGWYAFFYLIAYLNVGIAYMNILPIPALDGGRVVLLILEAIRHKPLSRNAVSNWQRVGIYLILGVAVLSTWNDFMNPMK